MKREVWIPIVIIIVIALGGIGVWFWKKKAKEKKAKTDDVTKKETNNNTVVNQFTNDNFPLKKGSGGAHVVALQMAIVKRGGSVGKFGIDGKFGNDTEAGLIALKLPTIVSQADFTEIVGANPDSKLGTEGNQSDLTINVTKTYNDIVETGKTVLTKAAKIMLDPLGILGINK